MYLKLKMSTIDVYQCNRLIIAHICFEAISKNLGKTGIEAVNKDNVAIMFTITVRGG